MPARSRCWASRPQRPRMSTAWVFFSTSSSPAVVPIKSHRAIPMKLTTPSPSRRPSAPASRSSGQTRWLDRPRRSPRRGGRSPAELCTTPRRRSRADRAPRTPQGAGGAGMPWPGSSRMILTTTSRAGRCWRSRDSLALPHGQVRPVASRGLDRRSVAGRRPAGWTARIDHRPGPRSSRPGSCRISYRTARLAMDGLFAQISNCHELNAPGLQPVRAGTSRSGSALL